MLNFDPKIKWHSDVIIKLIPLFAFVIPLVLLYALNPFDSYLNLTAQDSFQLMWKGRTFQLFFIWLLALEFILGWETIKPKISKKNTATVCAVAIASVLPTLYMVFENYFELNKAIANSALQIGITFYDSMPLAIEYLVFSALLCLIVFLYFGKNGLKGFALPALFVALVGILYTIDNVFPYGQFTPFQLLVTTAAILAAKTLGLMGYGTLLGTENGMPTLQVTGTLGTAKFAIAWPCAGIESLLIFMAVVLLFLQRIPMSWKAKVGYFIVGATVTYFINILRIDTLFTIGMQYGVTSNQVQMFHFYYGPMYSIAWIVSYPLVIILSQGLWHKFKTEKLVSTQEIMKHQPARLNPV
jgi:thaumarchaeosortase